MNLLIISTGKTVEVPDSFALRLIEQGRAKLASKKEAKPKKEAKKEEG